MKALTKIITFRVAEDDYEIIRKAASMTVGDPSKFFRDVGLPAARKILKKALK